MKELIRKLFGIEPEIIEKEIFVPKEVIVTKEIPIAAVGEMLDKLSEQLSNRDTVLQLCRREANDYERGRIQGQIDMLSKIYMELSNAEES